MRLKFRTLRAASLLVLTLFSSTVQAADFDEPNLADYALPSASSSPGWYVSGFGGLNFLKSTVFDIYDGSGVVPVHNRYNTGFVAGAAVGYDIKTLVDPIGLRLEAEFSYRGNSVKSHAVDGGAANELGGALGSTNVYAGMANLLFDIELGHAFSLYLGGGVGGANVGFSGHGIDGIGVVLNDDEIVLATQFIAGAGYEISPGLVADLQYRYFSTDSAWISSADLLGPSTKTPVDYTSNSIMMGLRWSM